MVGLPTSQWATPVQSLFPGYGPRVARESSRSPKSEQASQSINEESNPEEQLPKAELLSTNEIKEEESTLNISNSQAEASHTEETAQEKGNSHLQRAKTFSPSKARGTSYSKGLHNVDSSSTSKDKNGNHNHSNESIISRLLAGLVLDPVGRGVPSPDKKCTSEGPVPFTYGEWVVEHMHYFDGESGFDIQQKLDMIVTEYMNYLERFPPVYLTTFSSHIEEVHASEIECSIWAITALTTPSLYAFKGCIEILRPLYRRDFPGLDEYQIFRRLQAVCSERLISVSSDDHAEFMI